MDRTTLAQILVTIVLLGAVPPLLPAEGERRGGPLGRGGLVHQARINRRLAPMDPAERAGLMRFRGIVGPARMVEVFEVVGRVHAESPPGERVEVYARGMGRNDVWMLAFDLYPHRVLANFRPNGTTARDAVPEGVEWSITLGPRGDEGLVLERHF